VQLASSFRAGKVITGDRFAATHTAIFHTAARCAFKKETVLSFKIFIVSIFACLLISISTSGQNYRHRIDSLVNDYKIQLLKYMHDDTLASLSVAVLIDGKIGWSDAFGYADSKNKIFADTNTIYRIGSLTKPITAFLMMQMIDEGYFKLDDKIEDYFPEIKKLIGYSDSTKITFRQLATHTSGLPFNPDNPDASIGSIDKWEEKVIEEIPHTSFKFKPGEKESYSNYGYAILGLAISRAVKQPYIDLVCNKIFIPLKMYNSYFIVPDNKVNHLSAGTMTESYEQYKDVPAMEHKGKGFHVPAGCVYSTPNDFSKFMQVLMGVSNTKIIKDSTLALMKSMQIGLGHGGSTAGYTAFYIIDDKTKDGVIIMRNYFPEYGYRDYTKRFMAALTGKK
jgi:CubicO group peptidase (beta-lactamase class C family)